MKKLPIGIQDLEEIINGNYIYVDKTKYIYDLLELKYYFFSRPRRFGKSLTISTLENVFRGNKELFKDTWIYNSDYDWKVYPVIRLDFSQCKETNSIELEEFIRKQIFKIAKEYNIDFFSSTSNNGMLFDDLIKGMGKLGGAVILVDEYDAPIVHKINKQEEGEKNREKLSKIFSQIKGNDGNIKFCFISGISKFSKTSIFSELNNLNDISIDGLKNKKEYNEDNNKDKVKFSDYNAFCGYTEEEIKFYFENYIKEICENENINKEELLNKIKYWYDGYSFSSVKKDDIYNPFSIINFFKSGLFRNYWVQSGNTKFLIDMIKKNNFETLNMENIKISNTMLNAIDFELIELETLLFQTGYLTIKGYDGDIYLLGIPNFEIRSAFFEQLIKIIYRYKQTIEQGFINRIKELLKTNNFEELFENIKYYLAGIPYDIKIASERYYQSALYHLFNFTAMRAKTEQKTNIGRIDLVVETDTAFYIFELKMNRKSKDAIKQVLDREYYKEFLKYNKNIFIFGVNFNKKKGNLDNYEVMKIQ